jgi:general secretion pathway protein A
VINLLCDRALLGAFARGAAAVDRSILSQAAMEVSGRRLSGRFPRPAFITAAVAAGAVAALFPFLLTGRQGPSLEGTAKSRSLPTAIAAPEVTRPPLQSAPAAAATPPERGIEWLFAASKGGTRRDAEIKLLRLWGVDVEGGKAEDPCLLARREGLRCLDGKGSLSDLGRLDRPALLRLSGTDGNPFYAVLTGLEGKKATLLFESGGGKVELRWFGEYRILWRPPPGYRRTLRPGSSSAAVSGLRNLFAASGSGSTVHGDDDFFDRGLVEEVTSFQQRRGLVTDGIVGPLTIIHLNRAARVGGPRLAPGGGES